MNRKLTRDELLFLMKFAAPSRPLNVLYRGQDDVMLVGEPTSWATKALQCFRTNDPQRAYEIVWVYFNSPPAQTGQTYVPQRPFFTVSW